ncbi:unnamed protein product [Gadus morhua 'NCC']
MSQNFPYRRFPAQTETPPPDYDSRRPVGGESDFYGQPQPTRSLAHQQSSPSSTETPHPAQGSDVAVGLLRSYGLDPTDLARLAELPEEMLNLDSLPHLLRQLKEGRETPSAPPPPLPATAIAPLSSRHPGASRPAAPSAPAANDQWAQIRNQPVQYPLGHILSAAKSRSFAPLSCDRQDRRADPRPAPAAGSNKHPSGAEKPPPPLSTSSCYMLDYGHQGGTAYHGKQGRADRYDRPAHGQPASGRTALPRHSQSDPAGSYGSGPARDPHRAQHRAEPPQDLLPHSRAGAGPAVAAPTAPTRKEALDFHGSSPGAFPYSCSLCDVLALSAKVWTQHINGSHHADKQLALLQRYPEWDCRMGRKSRFNDEPEKPKDKERPALRPQTTNRKPEHQRNKRMAKKTGGGNSKVVCAKFEAKCVDEVCLRTLIEPFGKIVKVLMFPCLAFVEMGSNEQARDLEKYYGSNPAAVQGKEVTFELSSTFSFLQSSRVLSFTPAPPGEDGFSDLISVVKRFGAPLYTLALPSLAFVEMKIEAEAQKLVNYYATNSLKVNGAEIKVSFSGEYNTLMRVSTARKYEEQEKGAEGAGGGGSCVTKRSRSRSPRKGSSPGADGSHPKRSRWGGEEGERKRRSSSPSRERRQGSHQPPRASDGVSLTEEAVVDADTPPAQPGSEAEFGIPAGSDPDTNEAGTTHDTAETSEEESDIEGMAVIGEDGESLDDDDGDGDGDGTSDTSGPPEQIKVKEEPEEETQICEEKETASVPELNNPKEVDEEGEEEEPNFLDILENCITLDELCEEDKEENDEKEMEKEEEEKNEKETEMEEEEKDEKEMEKEEEECIYEDKQEEGESKVIYFRNLPSSCFTDGEFVDLVKDQGKAVRYFLVPDRREGFIQMSSGSEAVLASRELLGNNPSFKGSVMDLTLTDKYPSVSAGWKVLDSGPDEDRVEGTRRSGRSGSHSASPPPPTALTEEPSHLSAAEEESPPSSRKSSSEQQEVEVPRREDTPTQEVDGSEDAASEPGSDDQEQPDEAGGDETTPTPEGQTPQTDENSEGVCLEDVESEQTAACTERLGQPQPGPAGGDVEPAKPTKPIGAEFVRPVVGYFCNLCEVIYVDEEEAKVEHCSSLIHYQKYKEHTGQDPWST